MVVLCFLLEGTSDEKVIDLTFSYNKLNHERDIRQRMFITILVLSYSRGASSLIHDEGSIQIEEPSSGSILVWIGNGFHMHSLLMQRFACTYEYDFIQDLGVVLLKRFSTLSPW